jgi:hypothetical protein
LKVGGLVMNLVETATLSAISLPYILEWDGAYNNLVHRLKDFKEKMIDFNRIAEGEILYLKFIGIS